MSALATESVEVRGPVGPLEVSVALPPHARVGVALVTHPHPQQGGTMENKVVQTLARTFQSLGYVAVRFNFRGVGKSVGTFDHGRGETEDALAVLAYARTRFGEALPLVLAGFSFGSYVQTRVAKQVPAQRLVLVAPAVRRFEVETVPEDTIVIHGDEDDVVPLADVLAWAKPQLLPVTVFPGCGHFFHGRLTQLRSVITGQWHGPRAA